MRVFCQYTGLVACPVVVRGVIGIVFGNVVAWSSVFSSWTVWNHFGKSPGESVACGIILVGDPGLSVFVRSVVLGN